MAMVDGALATLIDLGTRYFALRSDAAWPGVVTELGGRAQASLDALGTLVSGLRHTTVAASGWSVGDMWLYSAVAWLNGLPARAPTFANAAQLLTLGWSLPASLTAWALPHAKQEDVATL
jgi:hypothetical protein